MPAMPPPPRIVHRLPKPTPLPPIVQPHALNILMAMAQGEEVFDMGYRCYLYPSHRNVPGEVVERLARCGMVSKLQGSLLHTYSITEAGREELRLMSVRHGL